MATSTRLISNFRLGPLGATAYPLMNVTYQGVQNTALVSTQTFQVGSSGITCNLTGSTQGVFAFVDDQVNPQTILCFFSGTSAGTAYTVATAFSATTPFSCAIGSTAPTTLSFINPTAGTTTIRVCTW